MQQRICVRGVRTQVLRAAVFGGLLVHSFVMLHGGAALEVVSSFRTTWGVVTTCPYPQQGPVERGNVNLPDCPYARCFAVAGTVTSGPCSLPAGKWNVDGVDLRRGRCRYTTPNTSTQIHTTKGNLRSLLKVASERLAMEPASEMDVLDAEAYLAHHGQRSG